MDKKNKKGADQILTLYWFLIIFLIAGAVVFMASLFYGTPFDIRNSEGQILGDQIANCLTDKGYINDQVFSPDFQNNFLKDCHIDFTTEDFSDWKTNLQYYAEVEVDQFIPNPIQQSYGETGNTIATNIGNKIVDVSAGNINLKTAWEIVTPSTGFLGLNLNKRNVNTIVVHATEGADAVGAIESISTADLSIHYMIDRDGTIISVNNVNQFVPAQYTNAFVDESVIAQHAGCFDTRTNTHWTPCSPSCTSDGLIATSCQALSTPPQNSYCCIEENPKSIGIELVNLGSLCGSTTYKNSQYCKNSVTIDGQQWEPYSEAQLTALTKLISDISSRYNIPLNRDHIIGHYQTSTYKTDPGPQFPWDTFMQGLIERGAVPIPSSSEASGQQQRSFYALDKNGNQYLIKILSLVGKTEKNV
jgi:N-acetyl-anhydromuramyl-L-alanine amidase AmpD